VESKPLVNPDIQPRPTPQVPEPSAQEPKVPDSDQRTTERFQTHQHPLPPGNETDYSFSYLLVAVLSYIVLVLKYKSDQWIQFRVSEIFSM
jgi:hypothetical protein